MALVGKPQVEGDFRAGRPLRSFPRTGQAPLLEPGVGRQAGGLAEHPGEVERRQVDRRRQRFERRWVGQLAFQQFAGAGHGQWLVAGGRGFSALPVSLHQRQHRLAPGGLLLQGTGASFGQLVQLAEGDRQGRVMDHAVLEARHAVAAQLQFVEHARDPRVLGVARGSATPLRGLWRRYAARRG
jgi:hypothetical protein